MHAAVYISATSSHAYMRIVRLYSATCGSGIARASLESQFREPVQRVRFADLNIEALHNGSNVAQDVAES
jgi:hypothetical protein